ncbi:hypothetical protein [Brumimicrobium aurantiacum]|uniref:Glycosyltransferase RgtA/B/C/D-like domain-containing protein n=1 Tax=Brumimicrobium aurantiacum TaxID=1737063 RepID=A0A3E1EUW7_9FLAO|nr:hypothetical protein [Brumimicrobium aurantiacum]RFC53347.1 hypothetical protein DXU93_13015 [Brumimicrobium aurantiacum]
MHKTALIIALLSLLSAFFFNEVNISYLKKDGVPLRANQTVITADDVSYLRPAQNYLETGELRNNMIGNGAYFLRPPGYSTFYICLGSFLGHQQTLMTLKYVQLILFGLSVYCLFFIAFGFIKAKNISILITSIYGISGIAFNFIFYTLTEAVTPALVIFFVYFLIQAKSEKQQKKKLINYYTSALIFCFLFITRPVLGILGLAFPFFIFADFWKVRQQFILHLFLIGIVASSGMILWQVRNYNISNTIVGLNPIYYPENNQSSFRPTHEALWDLCKGWGEIGANFHSYVGPFWSSAINGKTDKEEIEKIIQHIPLEVVQALGRDKFEKMFKSYQQSILYQKEFKERKLAMPKEIPAIEQQTIHQIEALTEEFKHEFWFQYYISSPLKVFKELAFHSNLSLYIFQKTFRGNFFMEALRIFTFSIHVFAFIVLFISPFYKKEWVLKSIFSFAPLLYVLFLIFVQRGIEERYSLPILPLVLVSFGYLLMLLNTFIKQKLKTQQNAIT